MAFSTDKFASHEKTKKHNAMFGNHNWSDLYIAAGIDSGAGRADDRDAGAAPE